MTTATSGCIHSIIIIIRAAVRKCDAIILKTTVTDGIRPAVVKIASPVSCASIMFVVIFITTIYDIYNLRSDTIPITVKHTKDISN